MKTVSLGSRGEDVKVLQNALNLFPDGVFGKITHEAVVAYQKEHNLVPDGVVGDKTWKMLLSTWPVKCKRIITDIVVHCTASKEGKPLSVADITKEHIKRGFGTIGYHYVILLDGTIAKGRSDDKIGAHVAGYNAHSIGISYVGGLDANGKAKDTRTPKQKESLVKLLKDLRKLYPNAKIKGHRDYSPDKNHNGIVEPFEYIKMCPCFNAMEEYKSI